VKILWRRNREGEIMDVVEYEVNLHSTESKKKEDRCLCSWIHLDVPNHESRQDAECPICPTADRGVDICSPAYNDRIDAVSLHASVLSPEVADGLALK
jgi:hypothetical protein